MSDERFDQDLRSVLLEDGPRDVPDDLRNRVAVIAATHPVTADRARPAWRRPIALSLGGLAAAVLVVVILWRFLPPALPGVGGEQSPSPSVPATASLSVVPSPSLSNVPISSPSPVPSPSASVGACRAADLAGRILGWGGAAGSRIADVEVTNTSASPCVIRGTPGLELVDATGRVLIDSASAGPSGQPHVAPADPRFELAPGGHVRTQVQASNYCGPAPSLPIDIAFTLPSGDGRFVAIPGTGVSSAEAVPPCLGATGANIAMNGWRR